MLPHACRATTLACSQQKRSDTSKTQDTDHGDVPRKLTDAADRSAHCVPLPVIRGCLRAAFL